MLLFVLCPGCRQTPLGREYIGRVSHTVSGRTCQWWTSNTPHVPDSAAQNDLNYPDGSRLAAKNYCRNPDSDPVGPWCYTTDPNVRWEKCNVHAYCGTCNAYSFHFISIVVCRINKHTNLDTATNNSLSECRISTLLTIDLHRYHLTKS